MRPTPIQSYVTQIRNEFGTVELEPVTGILPIAQLSSALPAAQMHRFDLDTAERIALITENRGVQICCPMHWRGQQIWSCTMVLQLALFAACRWLSG